MKQNIDELINKYIDDELTSNELTAFNNLIEKDESVLRKVKAQKLVNAYLNEIEFDAAPAVVAQKIMLKVGQTLSKNLDRNYFFFGTLGFLVLTLIGSIVFFFNYFGKADTKYTGAENLITSVTQYINNFVAGISAQFIDANVMLIISTITLVVMLGIYFLFETHKSFRKKLHTLS